MNWNKNALAYLSMIFVFLACQAGKSSDETESMSSQTEEDRVIELLEDSLSLIDRSIEGWKDIMIALPNARFDITYAGINNFTGKKIYDCPACLLRDEVGEALIMAASYAETMGYGFIIYDCYRPAPYQQRLWDFKPDARYVMPPWKGSNHSRGAAVDLSLYNLKSGKILDMGTNYDHLGPESHWDYEGISAEARENRLVILEIMEKAGFRTISTEWWHYDYKEKKYELASFLWPCED